MISEKKLKSKLKEFVKPYKELFTDERIDLWIGLIRFAGFNEQRDCLERGKDATL